MEKSVVSEISRRFGESFRAWFHVRNVFQIVRAQKGVLGRSELDKGSKQKLGHLVEGCWLYEGST